MSNAEINENYKKDTSNLALSETYVPDVPKDIIFPDELNAYLRDQIQYLTHENGMLKRNLLETETKLKDEQTHVQNLSKQIKQYDDACPTNNFSSISNVATAKIVELSKKLREKSSEIESVKTKYSKLEHQLFLLQQKESECEQSEKEIRPVKSNIDQDEIKQLQDRLNSVSSKLFESKNANIQLKNDLKLANKFLQQEIGDNFETLQNMANSGSNWRGRAQIICDLQQKNNEFREKLKQLQEKKPDAKFMEPSTNLKHDRRVEILSKENLNLKSDIQELKKKLDGSRARTKALESENSALKTKTTMLVEQQQNDRDLIATLTGQLSTIKNVQSDDEKKKDQMIIKLQRECKNLQSELSKEQCKYENMKTELENKISELNQTRDNRFSRPPSTKNRNIGAMDDKPIARLETERLRLLELTEMTNKRLENERKHLAELQMQYKVERQKNAKLEAKVARMELDGSARQSTYSLMSSRTREEEYSLKDRLELSEENVKALKTRLEIEQKERQIDFQEFSEILRNYTLRTNQ